MSFAPAVVLFYFFAKSVMKQFGPNSPAVAPGETPLLTKYSPATPSGSLVDMWAFFSESEDALNQEAAKLVWHEKRILLGTIPERSTTITYRPTPVGLFTSHIVPLLLHTFRDFVPVKPFHNADSFYFNRNFILSCATCSTCDTLSVDSCSTLLGFACAGPQQVLYQYLRVRELRGDG